MNKTGFIILILLSSCSISFGQKNSIDWNKFLEFSDGTEIAVGIFENEEISKYGFIIEQNELRKKTNSLSLFEIGSITKVFTTIAALQVLKSNQIEITQPVVQYLTGNDKSISEEITFYKLMTHTSGLPKMPKNFFWSALRCPSDPFLHYCEKRMFKSLSKLTPNEKEAFLYSNLGMALLGYLSSNMEKQSLASLMETKIFQPLRMASTSLGISNEQFSSVVNYHGTNKEPKRTWKFSEVTQGAGNVYSSLNDLTLFLQFILSNNDITNNLYATILEMEKEQISISESESMGLGWRIHNNKARIIYHGGITYGFKSLIAYNRSQEKGIVILTNAKGLSRKENKILKELCFEYLAGN